MNTEIELQKFGLEGRESRVYLAALKLGKGRVTEIAKESGYERTYCYSILENLEKLELVTRVEPKGKVSTFVASHPKKLKEIAKEKLNAVTSAMPQLRSIYDVQDDQPVVKFLLGKDGIKTVYEEIVNCKSKAAHGIINPDIAYKVVGKILEINMKKCIERGVVVNDLIVDGKMAKKFMEGKRAQKAKMRIMPKGFKFENDFLIYDNKVAQISFKEPIHGYIIESKDIAEAWRSIYKALWTISK